MIQEWINAGGEYQVLFLRALNQIIDKNYQVECPKCKNENLKYYFHQFNQETGTGTIWAWCNYCKITCHLPRVKILKNDFPDPFDSVDIYEFAEIEMDNNITFFDRLNSLWDKGVIW